MTPSTTAPAAATTVRTTIDVAADPERVFDALTDPDELAEWWGADDAYHTHDWTVDPRPGGAWHADTVDAAGRAGSIGGAFTVVDRPRVLETTWRTSWDEPVPDDDGVSTVRYELEPIDVGGESGTRLTVTHTGPATAPNPRAALRLAEYVARAVPAYA